TVPRRDPGGHGRALVEKGPRPLPPSRGAAVPILSSGRNDARAQSVPTRRLRPLLRRRELQRLPVLRATRRSLLAVLLAQPRADLPLREGELQAPRSRRGRARRGQGSLREP